MVSEPMVVCGKGGEHSKKTKTISGFFIWGFKRKPVSKLVSINALDCDSNSPLTSCLVQYKLKPPLNKVFCCAWRVLKHEIWEYLSILFASRAQNNGSRYRILKHGTKPEDVQWWCLDQIHCTIKLFGFQNPSSQASGTTHAILFGVKFLTQQHGHGKN